MTLRCREGDLAIIVRSKAGNEGKIVRCVRLATLQEIEDHWFIASRGPYWVIDRMIPTRLGRTAQLYRDSWLRPIRGDEQPESISTDRTEPVTA